MGGKVFHVDDETHRLVAEFCEKTGVSRAVWVCETLRSAVGAPASMEPDPVPKALPAEVAIVPRKPRTLRQVQKEADKQDENVLSRPPFWSGRPKS